MAAKILKPHCGNNPNKAPRTGPSFCNRKKIRSSLLEGLLSNISMIIYVTSKIGNVNHVSSNVCDNKCKIISITSQPLYFT